MNFHDMTISGIKLKFPQKPYPCQISMMQQIIKGLQKKENCLLESPTGSGKTLSLLCSAIAWQKFEKQEIIRSANEHYEIMEQKLRESCYCDCEAKRAQRSKRSKPRKIGYEDENGIISSDEEKDWESDKNTNSNEPIDGCACVCHGTYNEENPAFKSKKTHKQIANVINEFKKSPYANDTRMTILSSRSHTCIHPQVSRMSNKDDGCKKLNKKGQSILEMHTDIESSNDTMYTDNDLTDAAPVQPGGCSFNQKLKSKPMVYESYGFKQAVWDIEELITVIKRKKMCPYYAARDLTNHVDIIFCPYNYLIDPKIRASMSIGLDEQIVIIDEAHNIEDSSRDAASVSITKHQIELAMIDLNKLLNGKVYQKEIDGQMVEIPSQEDLNVCRYFVGIFSKLIDWIELNSMNMTPHNFEDSISKTWNGMEMVSQFKMLGMGPEKYELLRSYVGKLRPENAEMEFASDAIKIVADRLSLVMEFLYMEDHGYMDDYKVVIIKSKFDNTASQSGEEPIVQSTQFKKTQIKLPEHNFSINFWCLNPAVAFYYFRKCHSVILCSGTLSPMDSFQTELGVTFPLKLEANHVITDRQVWVGCVGTGPTNVKLLVTHKEIETFAFQDEVGRLILDICKSMPYGILCFFPSYSLLKKLHGRWLENGLIKKIEEFKKIFSETKFSEKLLSDYYECVNNNTAGKSNEGALLFAVYRGRCSEGLDFSNNYARAVIAFGIPFPNIMDKQVKLKKEYNDIKSRKKNVLTGNEWYEIQAYRALNQALGRCIRHREDWGAIILVDDRYFKQPDKYSKGLSKWIRTKFRTFKSYNEAYASLTKFGTEMKDFQGSFHPLPVQENSVSQIDSTLDSITTVCPQELKPIAMLTIERVELKNIDRNEIEGFLQKYPQTISMVKEEFLSDDLKARIHLEKMNTLQLSTPVQKEAFSIFSSLPKKRIREYKDDDGIINSRNILADNNGQKKLLASASKIDLNNFKHKTNKYEFSKEPKTTENDPIIVEDLNTTIELVDSDDDEYDYKIIKQNKRMNILDTTQSIEVLDVVDNCANKNGDSELVFDISPDINLEKKIKQKKTNLQLLMDS